MKIWLSKPRKKQKRHVVLDMSTEDDYAALSLIRRHILGPGVAPVRKQKGTKVRYRFHMKYLEDLMLMFPYAELSDGLHQQLARASEVEQADVPDIEVEELVGIELYDYQKIGVQAILDGMESERHAFLLNDEMGLGKTFMALAAALLAEEWPLLIVCPNNAKWVWARAIRNHTDLTVEICDGPASRRMAQIDSGADVVVANVEMLRVKTSGKGKNKEYHPAFPNLYDGEWGMVIADEFHRFKNPTAQQTQGFQLLQHYLFIGLSGTPIENRIEEAWVVLNKIEPETYPSYYMFEKWLKVGTAGTAAYNPEAMKQVKQDLADWSLRRRKDQVIKDLPRVIEIDHPVTLVGEQKRLYDRIENEQRLELETGEEKGITGILPKITRCKQAAFSPELYEGSPNSAKIKELKLIVEELVANGEKAIIGTQWSTAARIIEREFMEYNPAYVDGSVKGEKRVVQEDKFNQDDDCKLYIGTIGANKESITLNAATYVILTDKAWNPMTNAQFVARSAAGGLRGVGVEKPIHVISLIGEDTIEEPIEDLLARKQLMFNALVESDGGRKIKKITASDMRALFYRDELEEEAA